LRGHDDIGQSSAVGGHTVFRGRAPASSAQAGETFIVAMATLAIRTALRIFVSLQIVKLFASSFRLPVRAAVAHTPTRQK
jgi:hypothetical protein